MGAQGSKRWSELTPETPQVVDKKLTKLQLDDPRSPSAVQRTPIRLETYEESPFNRELNIADPRSPSPLIDRTPITVNKPGKITVDDSVKDSIPGPDKSHQVDRHTEKETATVEREPASPEISQISEILGQTSITPESPGAPLSKKDTARLLKKTSSPGDFKRQRRMSGRRQSVPQKLFSDKVLPAPRSPLAQKNSVDITGAAKKGNKISFRAQQTKRISLQEGLFSGKENARAPLVL